MAAFITFDRAIAWQVESARADGARADDPVGDTAVQQDPDAVIHLFVMCPPLSLGCAYKLVRRDATGIQVLAEGRAAHAHAPLNLAMVRQTGARLGATEVHVWNAGASRQPSDALQP